MLRRKPLSFLVGLWIGKAAADALALLWLRSQTVNMDDRRMQGDQRRTGNYQEWVYLPNNHEDYASGNNRAGDDACENSTKTSGFGRFD